jgi:hypothetical protein
MLSVLIYILLEIDPVTGGANSFLDYGILGSFAFVLIGAVVALYKYGEKEKTAFREYLIKVNQEHHKTIEGNTKALLLNARNSREQTIINKELLEILKKQTSNV